MSNVHYDLQTTKDAARGLWSTIHFKILGYALPEKAGPCPIHGGDTKLNQFKDYDETGGGVCNDCGKMADGFEVIKRLLGCSFMDAIRLVAELLAVPPKQASAPREKQDPSKNIKFLAWSDSMAKIWASRKRPIDPVALALVSAKYGQYRNQYPVIAIPIIGKQKQPVGWCMHHATGKQLPVYKKGSPEPASWVKTKVATGSDAGWIGPSEQSSDQVIFKFEGSSDLLAFLSLGLRPGHNACTNAFGCKEDPASNPWLLDRFKDKRVYVIHDCDVPGQEGATEVSNGADRKRPGWAPAIANIAKEVRNVVLPFPIEKDHGKDVRDWITDRLNEGLTKQEVYQRLLSLADKADIVKPIAIKPKNQPVDISQLEAEAVDDPHRLARINLEKYRETYGRVIKYWKETWYSWKDGRYEEMTSDHFETRLNASIKEEFDRAWRSEAEAYIAWLGSPDYSKEADRGQPKVRKVTKTLTQNVIQATKSLTALRNGQQLHAWTDGKDRGHCIACENGILNITKAVSSEVPEPTRDEILLPHTPDWFSTFRLDFGFDENAQCPSWIKFLDDVFNGDVESIDLLQKWFGYLLTPDNSLNKILFVIGQTRSGKGTILHTIKKLFGEANVATPTLNGLSREFSLQPLLGKTIAIIPDARLSERADEVTITERLLSISGGDPQDVARKYKDSLTSFGLKIRFTLFSNMLPRIKDPSAAFISRCVFLRMPNSYVGREDLTLRDRLDAEMSGILNWAIMGRHLLNQSKKLHQPAMANPLVAEMQAIISPMLEFLNTSCQIGNDLWCDTKELFGKWEQWCEANDVASPGNIQSFARKLKAINPQIETERVKVGASAMRRFVGLTYRESNPF